MECAWLHKIIIIFFSPHDHVLRPLRDLPIDLKKVTLLQRLEPEVVELEVPVVDDGGVVAVLVIHDDLVVALGDKGGRLAGFGVDVVMENLNVIREPG